MYADNSFKEATAFYATLAGLEDMELRNQVITRANLDKTVDLAKLEAHCTTYESACRNQVGQVEGMGTSEYRKQPTNPMVQKGQGIGGVHEPTCGYC